MVVHVVNGSWKSRRHKKMVGFPHERRERKDGVDMDGTYIVNFLCQVKQSA